MTTSTLRRGLLALFVAITAVTLWTIRTPGGSRPTAPPEASPTPGGSKGDTKAKGIVYRSFKEGEESRVVEAESSVGKEGAEQRLRGVKMTLGYLARGKKEALVIASDECLYNPAVPRATFEGHVVLTTSDGLEVHTDSLVYRGDKGLARTEAPAQFKRKDVSGSATGITYSSAEQRISLDADAQVRIENEQGPPTEIRSRQAVLEKSEGALRFEDDAVLTQGGDVLRADRLLLSFDPETNLVTRAIAAGGVDFKTTGGQALPGDLSPGASKGPRHLLCRKLDISFRPDRTLERVIAQKDVDLTLLPGPREVKEKRRVRAESYLIFDYDEQGRLVSTRGSKEASIVAEPFGPRAAQARSVTCQRFEAALDPGTGEATSAAFFDRVVFTRGSQHARAGSARYEKAGAFLVLQDAPEVEDEKGKLAARAIRLATETGDAEAEGDVRHVLRPQERAGFLSGKDAPTLITSRTFSSIQKTNAATYAGGALLRSGKDEVRAGSIVIQDDASGRRSMKATDSVVSLLNPKADKPGTKSPNALEGRGDEMTYEEAANLIVYTGNAVIRQGDIVTRSPKATMTLTSDGGGIESLVAGEPVEVEQGNRRASGTRGTYTPGSETMVLVGDNALMQDPQHKSAGRSLTFHVGDDRILVDGQEEGRTETILQNAPAKP